MNIINHYITIVRSILLLLVLLIGLSVPQLSYAYQAVSPADSLFEAGLEAYLDSRTDDAESLFMNVLELGPTPRTTASRFMLVRITADSGNREQILAAADRFLGDFPESKYVSDIFILKAETEFKAGNNYLAMQELARVFSKTENIQARNKAAEAVANLFIPELPDELLDEYLQIGSDPEFAALIKLKKAQKAVNEGDYEHGLELVNSIGSEISSIKVRQSIEEMKSFLERDMMNERFIAVLMPFTGEYSGQALGLYRGIKLALDEYNSTQSTPVTLKPVDTRGEIGRIPSIMREIMEDRTILGVIGPVDPDLQVLTVTLAEMYNIPVILPDNCATIDIEDYEYTFKMHSSPEHEGTALAQYAVNSLACSTFAVLSPIAEHGERIANSFAMEVDRLGGNVLVHEWYYPGAYDFSQQYKHIRNIGYGMMMTDSLDLFLRDELFDSVYIELDSLTIEENRDSLYAEIDSLHSDRMDSLSLVELDSLNRIYQDTLDSRRKEAGIHELDSLDIPVHTFDAFFIPVTDSEEMDFIINQLAFYNFRTTLLGNSTFYDLKMIERVNRGLRFMPLHFSSDYYEDDFYAPWIDFKNRIRSESGFTPGLDEMYGYDAANFVIKAMNYGSRTRQQLHRQLKDIRYIEGSPRGLVRFDETGQKSNWLFLHYRRGSIELQDLDEVR